MHHAQSMLSIAEIGNKALIEQEEIKDSLKDRMTLQRMVKVRTSEKQHRREWSLSLIVSGC